MRRRALPPTSWTTRRARASTTATTVSSTTSSAAAWPPSTATTTGATTCSSPAGPSRPRCTTTTARSAAPCGSHACPRHVTDLTAVTGAYPLDIDSDGKIDLVVLRRGGDVVLRGLGGCRFEPAGPAARHRPAARLDDRLQRDLGGLEQAADPGLRPLPGARRGPLRRQLAAAARRVRLSLRRSDRPRSGLLHAVDAVQRLEPLGPARPARVERPALLHRRRGAALADDARRATDGSTPRPTAGARCRSGAWASPARTSPATASPRCSSRARPTTSCRRSPTARREPDYRDIALKQRRHRAATLHRRRRAPVDGVASRVRRREQRRHRRPARHQGQRRRRRSTRPAATRATCSSARPDGSFVEGAEAAGIVSYDRARGAAVVDLNLDGLLDMVVVNRRTNVTLWRNVGARERGPARRDGPLDRRPAAAAGAERRRHRRLARRAGPATARPRARSRSAAATSAGSSAGSTPASAPRTSAEVRVQWPDGTIGPWMTVPAGERVTHRARRDGAAHLDADGVKRW